MKNIIIGLVNKIPRKLYYNKSYKEIKYMLKNRQGNNFYEKNKRRALMRQLKNALDNVPYYRNLNLNINSKDINEENCIEILKLFPYLDKKTIMNNPESFISDKVKKNSRMILKRTSGGSTGVGIKVYRTLKELMIERAFYDFEWEKYGYKPSSKIVRMGCDGIKKIDQSPFTWKGKKLLISPYHLNDSWIEIIYTKIKEHNVEFFHVYPSNIEYLAKYMKKNNLKIDTVKGIFLASERVSKQLLDLINDVFMDVPISFSYGLTERSNLAWGKYDGNKVSYNIEELYAYQENYIDDDGRYEIVGTSYWNTTMPFIRYRTQDFGHIINSEIKSLDGRNQEYLIDKNRRKIPGFTIDIDKFVWDYVEVFQVVQNQVGKIEFHIVTNTNYNSKIKNLILESQVKKWGSLFEIEIIEEKFIEKTKSGKCRLIVNNINIES